ncbi:MAG: roadblock/LC7 domain-containing protein [Candidatus Heimdallarchaeota archaeon]
MSQIGPQLPLTGHESPTNELLDEICAIAGVEKTVITSRGGRPLFSRPPLADRAALKEILFTGGMLAPLMMVVNESTKKMGREPCELLTLECQEDYIVVCEITGGATLAVAATKEFKLGLLHRVVREYQQKLASLQNDWS